MSIAIGLDMFVGTPALSPASVSLTRAWWRADDAHDAGSSKCDALAARYTNDADTNKNATQGGGPSQQPTITVADSDFNNQASLTFGGIIALVTGTWVNPLSDPLWVFAVVKSADNLYMFDDLGSGHRHSMGRLGGLLQAIESGASTGQTWSGATAAILFVFSNASGVSYINSTTSSPQTGLGSSGTLTGVTIGNYSGLGIGGAKIADLVVGTGIPSAPDVLTLMGYAAKRYALTIG